MYHYAECGERNKSQVGFPRFFVAGGDPLPVLKLVAEPLDEVASFVFCPVMLGWIVAVALGRDDCLGIGLGDLLIE